MGITIPDAAGIQSLKTRDWEQAQESYFSGRFRLSSMFDDYIKGVGTYDDSTLHRIRSKINGLSVAAGLIARTGSVFDLAGRLKEEYIHIVCEQLRESYYDFWPADLIASFVLLPETINEHHALSLPPQINMVANKRLRPSTLLYSTRGCSLYLHPYCYQAFSEERNWFCPSASNRSLSRVALTNQLKSAEVHRASQDIVIIQDRFPGSNFAHFLFDWVTRIGLICNSGQVERRNCLFAMGGAPGQFESMILAAVLDEYGLSEDQILFPKKGMLLRGSDRVLWFSDQVESYLHPAQMVHPDSINILRRIARRLQLIPDDRFKKIYVSRMDAARRRVTNEPEITTALRGYGFEPVVLSDFSVEKQMSLLANADQVIAPHGMGLTHLSLNQGSPSLIELHHPTVGGDDYALMTSAMGCSYKYVQGESAGGSYDDFNISVEKLLALMPERGSEVKYGKLSSPCLPLVDHARLLSGGMQGTPKLDGDYTFVPSTPFSPACPVVCHVRADPQAVPDSNVGAWPDIPVDDGRLYTASCWIWIPAAFQGQDVALSIGEWPMQWSRAANMNLREQWQKITATKTCPTNAKFCNVVLRVAAPMGSYVFSTNWEFLLGFG
jgi:Glycosyltransferase 61